VRNTDEVRTSRPARPAPGEEPSRDDAGPVDRQGRHRTALWVSIVVCVAVAIGAAVPFAMHFRSEPAVAPAQSVRYLGVYEQGVPSSYTGVTAFTAATGVSPNVLMYYSSWMEPFQAGFAASAARNGARALVQLDPTGISLAAIASGHYDSYLSSYAGAVRAFGHPVILSFGHEMNGYWYSWGHTKTSAQAFVAAWRHIVTVFRRQDVTNVTWLWTVNIIDQAGGILSPGPWWPGSSYVNWVGIDGYYYEPSWTFASLFGPTIAAVRGLTHDPILIAETGAASEQPAKISDLFAGIHLFGLMGFVYFDIKTTQEDWRITSRAAIGAYQRGAKSYHEPRP
jgi:mannan endo-1,4-beta-mannosidase